MPIEEALTILSHIGQALHYAHQQKIVHRDLKPDNILFNAQGEALLADFGIAEVLSTASTKQLDPRGTLPYMAPEQFEGKVSTKCDQYALGCIAYEMLTGRKPFTVPYPDMAAMWYQHAKVEPVPPTLLNPLIPAHIEETILKALAKQRDDRHTDVSVFITALQKSSRLALQKSFRQWFNEGNALHHLKRYEEALAAYEQALRLNPNDANVFNNKGLILYALKRYEESLASYEQALRLNPSDTNAYNGMGNTLHALKRYEEALAAYEQALHLKPNLAKAHYGKGYVLERLGRATDAQQSYTRAKQFDLN